MDDQGKPLLLIRFFQEHCSQEGSLLQIERPSRVGINEMLSLLVGLSRRESTQIKLRQGEVEWRQNTLHDLAVLLSKNCAQYLVPPNDLIEATLQRCNV
jgi:hypothetical protein